MAITTEAERGKRVNGLHSFQEQIKIAEHTETQNEILSCLESWETIREMEIKVEWVVDRLLPKEGITLLFGKGGIGKTWLVLDAARCIAGGLPFLGLGTIKAPVIFIDFENPLAVLNSRTQKLGEGPGVYFWRANNDKMKAPRLDSQEWERYKELPEGAVLIFDTLRAAQSKDENASNDMALIMNRLKELRDMGFTIILLHHTAKNSDYVAKGSTAIVDMADHNLGFTRVKKRSDGQDIIVDDDESDDDLLYKFGVRDKTRFEPFHVYLTLNPDRGFELAPDPQEESLKRMNQVLWKVGSLKKTDFISQCKNQLGISNQKTRRLFDIGHGRYWKEERLDMGNTLLVKQINFSNFHPIIE